MAAELFALTQGREEIGGSQITLASDVASKSEMAT